MRQFEDIFGGILDGYRSMSKIDILCRQSEFEKNLDDMWAIYVRGNPAQLVEYNKELDQIKSCGLKVLRNSSGKHIIVVLK